MTTPNINTFENDIKEEIKHKEATIGDIASAGGQVSNNPTLNGGNTGNHPVLIIFLILLAVIILSLFGYLGYVYMKGQPTTKEEVVEIIDAETARANTEAIISEKLNKISPTLALGMLRLTTKIEDNPNGTILSINDYTSSFAFMLNNETNIAKEVFSEELKAYENSTTTPEIVFTDETKSNQNMRIATVASSTFVYAFVGDEHLVFAKTPEEVLQIRGLIIK